MEYKFNHFNFNVKNLDESIKFYNEALGLKEIRRKEASDGSFTIVFMGDGSGTFSLELTCLKAKKSMLFLHLPPRGCSCPSCTNRAKFSHRFHRCAQIRRVWHPCHTHAATKLSSLRRTLRNLTICGHL